MVGVYLSAHRDTLIMTYDNEATANDVADRLNKRFPSDRFNFIVDKYDIPHNQTFGEAVEFMNNAFSLVENLAEYIKKNS